MISITFHPRSGSFESHVLKKRNKMFLKHVKETKSKRKKKSKKKTLLTNEEQNRVREEEEEK